MVPTDDVLVYTLNLFLDFKCAFREVIATLKFTPNCVFLAQIEEMMLTLIAFKIESEQIYFVI